MSRRKFRAPRHGSKSFLNKHHSKLKRGEIRSHPISNPSLPLHLTGFLGYKVGCTHVIREIVRPKSPLNGRETSEMVTLLETPPMVCVGYVLLKETPTGVVTVHKEHIPNLSEPYIRACEKKGAIFHNLTRPFSKSSFDKKDMENEEFDFVRVILHTIPPSNLKRIKAHVLESQINGGKDNNEKIEFAKNLLGKNVPVSAFCAQNEMIDISGITKGKGHQGPVKRFGIKVLSPKSRKGTRKVACIGPWHPSSVHFSVARSGQLGRHHRVEMNKMVLSIGKEAGEDKAGNASTPFDPTQKDITPMGGFKNYGILKNDYLMIKGSIAGAVKGCVALRKSMSGAYKRDMTQEARIKFIDTASKQGKGRFQTTKEKMEFYGKEIKENIVKE